MRSVASHWIAAGKRLYFLDVSAIGALPIENGFGSAVGLAARC